MKLFEYIDIMNQPYDIFYTDNIHSPLHWHYYSEILYIISGSIKIICNNKEIILYQGDTCYFYPLQLHEVAKNPECSDKVKYAVVKFNIYKINIPQAYLQKLYDYFLIRKSEQNFCFIIRKEQTDKLIEFYVQRIVEEYQQKKELYMLSVQSGIHSLLTIMARKAVSLNFEANKTYPNKDLLFYHILEYIDMHSSEILEVRKLAEMCHMSYSNFARLFRENYGCSCKKYIQYIRLNKAQDLLLNSNFDLNYIAQETGFFDCSYFIKTYKKWRGITPKQERDGHCNEKK